MRSREKGYLQEIFVDEGQSVKKGQLMFKIMPLLYQPNNRKLRAEANFAEIEYMNTKSLADSNVVSKNELALAKPNLIKPKRNYHWLRSTLHLLTSRLPLMALWITSRSGVEVWSTRAIYSPHSPTTARCGLF